jgi:hypothetical protein
VFGMPSILKSMKCRCWRSGHLASASLCAMLPHDNWMNCILNRLLVLLQVRNWCAAFDRCFTFDISRRAESLLNLTAWDGIVASAKAIGYDSLDNMLSDTDQNSEIVNLLSTFCLTPPGDTPTRRGFWDALAMGCIPVVFLEESRRWTWFFTAEQLNSMTLLVPSEEIEYDEGALQRILTAKLPDVPAMQQAIARHAASFQYSYQALDEDDHLEVGPDALDVIIAKMLDSKVPECVPTRRFW